MGFLVKVQSHNKTINSINSNLSYSEIINENLKLKRQLINKSILEYFNNIEKDKLIIRNNFLEQKIRNNIEKYDRNNVIEDNNGIRLTDGFKVVRRHLNFQDTKFTENYVKSLEEAFLILREKENNDIKVEYDKIINKFGSFKDIEYVFDEFNRIIEDFGNYEEIHNIFEYFSKLNKKYYSIQINNVIMIDMEQQLKRNVINQSILFHFNVKTCQAHILPVDKTIKSIIESSSHNYNKGYWKYYNYIYNNLLSANRVMDINISKYTYRLELINGLEYGLEYELIEDKYEELKKDYNIIFDKYINLKTKYDELGSDYSHILINNEVLRTKCEELERNNLLINGSINSCNNNKKEIIILKEENKKYKEKLEILMKLINEAN